MIKITSWGSTNRYILKLLEDINRSKTQTLTWVASSVYRKKSIFSPQFFTKVLSLQTPKPDMCSPSTIKPDNFGPRWVSKVVLSIHIFSENNKIIAKLLEFINSYFKIRKI